jgi:hypothetical protein
MHKQTHTVLRKARKNGVKGADQRGETKSASGESGESEGKEERNSGSEAADVDSGEGSSAPASTESAGGTRKGKAKTLDEFRVAEKQIVEEFLYRERVRWGTIRQVLQEHSEDCEKQHRREVDQLIAYYAEPHNRDVVIGRGGGKRAASKTKEVDGEITKGFKRGPGTELTFTDSSTSTEKDQENATSATDTTTDTTDHGASPLEDRRSVTVGQIDLKKKNTTFAKPNPKTTGKKGKL